MEAQVPVILLDSSSSEEEEVAAANVTKRKYEEYKQISDLSGFDNLRAMIEAEASMRRNRRERRKIKKMMKKQTESKTEKIIMVNIEKPVILITDSESEDANKLKKRKYEDEYRVIADLTGFDNLRGMMEAEAFRRRKARKRKKKNGKAVCYAQEEENNMAERAEEIISGNKNQEIKNSIILTASSKHVDANNMKKKLEDEYRVISDLTGFDNLRAMYEAEAFMRRKKRKRLRKGKEKIVCHAQEEVSVDATKDMGQSARVQAAETTEALEAASVEVDMARGEKQPVTNKVLERALLLEKETVGRNYKIVSRRRLGRSRYFDPPDGSWDIGSNGEERHTIVHYKVQKQKRPCYICASFDHSWKYCKQDSFVWKGKGHSAKDCLDDQRSNICLRCGGSGHSMLSCRNVYPPDDLKKIQCYMCNSFGHLCCVDFLDMHPRQLSCYTCGQSGHPGSECTKFRGENSRSKSAALRYSGGEESHIAGRCTNDVKVHFN
ncbi:uncharacterized protein LOC132189174 isoform X2 [Corylus avellana]|uniref:uncharacterized protein LOC132189174 isoform X2 n=1 Tax=Corylus avellana TaxID=13451 RepID=UPI00286AB2F6|nr:uncharacterized protein LOC132189174 isoform X2 [Corylus avellana]